MNTDANLLPWAILNVANQRYGIPCGVVREITQLNSWSEVPLAPKHMRGMINLRGRVLPLIDFRLWLGLPSVRSDAEALVKELVKREEDHRRWIAELEACVRENRPFSLARDPHKCAFGRWFDNFKSDDLRIRSLLFQLDVPHKAIHALADRVLAMKDDGDIEGALRLIGDARSTTLGTLIQQLGAFRDATLEAVRELAVVLQKENATLSITVDGVESIEQVSDHFDDAPGLDGNGGIKAIGKLLRDQSIFLVPDVETLFRDFAEAPEA